MQFIVSSTAFLKVLNELDCQPDSSVLLHVIKSQLLIETAHTKLDVMAKCSFEVPLYYRTIESLKRILRLIGDQPFNIRLEDSEIFNVKICEAYV